MSASNTRQFFIQASRPDSFSPSLKVPERPEFFRDAIAWNSIFEMTRETGIHYPVLAALDRAPWKNDLPEFTRLRLNERIIREQVLDSSAENEFRTAASALTFARIPLILSGEYFLAHRFYPASVYRRVQEIELIIPESALGDALRCLGRHAYRKAGENIFQRFQGGARIRLQAEEDSSQLWTRLNDLPVSGLPRMIHAMPVENLIARRIGTGAADALMALDLHFATEKSGFRATELCEEISLERCATRAYQMFNSISREYQTRLPAGTLDQLLGQLNPIKRRWLKRFAPSAELIS